MNLNIKDNVTFSNVATSLQQNSAHIQSTQTTIQNVSQTQQNNNIDKTLLQQQQAQEKLEAKEQLKNWVKVMNKTINEKVRFSYSEDFGGIYVTVIDSKTQEVIRKIPSDEALKLSAIWKEAVGNILDRKS